MRSHTFYSLAVLAFCFFASSSGSFAQELRSNTTHRKFEIKKRTILEEYEPLMVLTAEERLYLKKQREAILAYRKEIIDTLQISDKKKRRLLRELYLSPSSSQWDRLSAQILEDDEDEEN